VKSKYRATFDQWFYVISDGGGMILNYSVIFIIGFIIGTLVSANALYIIVKFFEYIKYKAQLKFDEDMDKHRKKEFSEEFDIDLEDRR